MKIYTRYNKEKTAGVLKIHGDLFKNADQTMSAAMAKIQDRGLHIIIDLKDVPSMNSQALGAIYQFWRAQSATGKRLILCGPSADVQNLLAMTKIDAILTVCKNTEEALDRVKG